MQKIIYGLYESPVGETVIGKTEAGLCWLGFMVAGYKGNGLERMTQHFKGAVFLRDDAAIKALGDQCIKAWEEGREANIPLDLHGTDFQKAVWAALLQIKRGSTCAYDDIANAIGMPRAARAVGGAVGTNPVSLIIPCHRVLQKSGVLGNYGWGADLKAEILRRENVRLAA